jgi:hypothetical protein
MTKLIIFENPNTSGKSEFITENTPRLTTIDDQVSSLIVVSGSWNIFTDSEYKGHKSSVSHDGGPDSDGVYPNPKAWGGTDNEISSIREILPSVKGKTVAYYEIENTGPAQVVTFNVDGTASVSMGTFTSGKQVYIIPEPIIGKWSGDENNIKLNYTIMGHGTGPNSRTPDIDISIHFTPQSGKWIGMGPNGIKVSIDFNNPNLLGTTWRSTICTRSNSLDKMGIIDVIFGDGGVLSAKITKTNTEVSRTTTGTWFQKNHNYITEFSITDDNDQKWNFVTFIDYWHSWVAMGTLDDTHDYSDRTFQKL